MYRGDVLHIATWTLSSIILQESVKFQRGQGGFLHFRGIFDDLGILGINIMHVPQTWREFSRCIYSLVGLDRV